ncbi:T9SS type A sorting domain-containing protein [Hymenobacter sp. BT175]|uniref:T9SS type A sorting domain-containing protein n=1 Tax=Hymenobacter translucens TaxID=2886507 RepID=UPI001D0E39B6|nr:T9SS type A sorting domain-containing protein [Hymenobacter translucens]MCC2547241.1 T9SS type A sorting domain-containing protein [Hymenobacter translucens]
MRTPLRKGWVTQHIRAGSLNSTIRLASRPTRWLLALSLLLLNLGSTLAQSTANYTFTTSSTGSLADMSGGTTDALATGVYRDDDASAVLPIGFTFVFMGTPYTQFSVNSNGQLRLGATAISGTNASPSSGQAILAAFGGDNAMQATGRIAYKVLPGTNRSLVVEWTGLRIPYVATPGAGTPSQIQVVLEENTGKIEYRYGEVFNNGTSVTRSIFISAGTAAGQIGVVKTFNATPTYDATVTSATTTSLTNSAAVAVLNSTADGARTVFTFTPLSGIPATPSVALTAVGQGSLNVVITDNSTNETFFVVSRSVDNITFTTVGTVASTSVTGTGTTLTLPQTGLTPGTTYYYRVVSGNEGGGTSTTPATATVTTLAAVPFCGTKTVGPAASADYPTLTAALTATSLNGVCGPLVLELQSDYVSTSETFPLVYGNVPGTSAANTVTIRPAAGATGLTISGSASQILNITGGRYLILDGRPGGSGATPGGAALATDLTISNTSTSGQAIQLTGDASFNTVQHTQLKGVGTSLSASPVVLFGSSTAGNSDNVFRFNNIGDGATLPYSLLYSSSSNNARNTITDNNLFNYYGASSNTAAAVYLSSAGTGWMITNNSIYQTGSRTPTSATHYGIYLGSGSAHTVTGNFIGGSAPGAGGTPHTVAGTAAAYRFVGIFLAASGAATSVQGNTIANVSWLSSSGATTGNGVLSGIYVSSGDVNIGTITGNIVGTATGPITVNISTGGGYSFGISTASSGTVTIARNTISNITTSGSTASIASNVAGINLGGGALNTVSQNKIYGLTASGGGASLSNGILITAGTTNTVSNNLIGGIAAPASTSLAAVSGIQLSGGTTNNLVFNTIRLDGTSSGATFGTQGIYLNSTTATLNLFNNLVVNLSTPVGTGGVATAIRRISGTAGTVPSNLFGNNNLYYAGTPSATNLMYVEGTTTQTNAKQTLADYKAFLLNREANSVTEAATPFASTTGSDANFLHLTPGAPTQAESAGQPYAGITTDFDGDVRNTSTPDIGADEGSFQLLDQTGPVISILAFNGSAASTTSRTLTVSITDVSGIATGANAPRLYFRKGSGAFAVAAAPTVAGSVYTFTLDYSLIGGVAAGDVINYYVAAQDVLGNLSTNPTGGTGTTPPGTTAPPVLYTFTILQTLSGTYYVSANSATSPVPGRTYATLTAAVAAYNTAGLGGAVTFLLLDPTYSTAETFPIAILNNPDASATNTLTIKPSNATGTTSFAITGSSATAILQLLASDYVTIDGSLGNTISATDPRPSRDLTITNTNTGTSSIVVQQFAQFTNDGATYNTIKNLTAVGATTATTAATLYGITLSGTSNATTPNQYTNNTVQNCAVRGTQVGIASLGGSVTLKNQNTVITQNDLNAAVGSGAITRNGVLLSFDNNAQVTQNTIANITNSSDVSGISLGFTISLFSNSNFTGNEVTNATVANNSISGVTSTGTFSAVGIGVASAASGTNTVVNNFVGGVAGNGTGGDFAAGIYVNGSAGGGATRVLYNSVSMSGTNPGSSAATQPNFALAVGGSSPTVEIRNNILYNSLTVNGAQSYAIGFAYAGTTSSYAGLTSSNNAFAGTNGIGLTGNLATGTVRATLADLFAETGQDRPVTATNPAGTSLMLSGSPFVSATDLHVLTTSAAGLALNGAGTPVAGITTDIDNETRSTTRPDIGADEFAANLDVSVSALTAPVATSSCFSATEAVIASITNSASAALNFAVTPVTVTVTITGSGGTQTFSTVVNTGTLGAGASQTVTLPGTIDLSVPGTYTATVTTSVAGDDNLANNTLTPAVTITSTTRSAAFTFPSGTICAGGSGTVAPTLAAGATAGTFSSTAGLTINATTGVITPGTSTAGTYVVSNTLPATATCPALVVTQSVTITPATTATFSYPAATFCVSGTNPTATVMGTAGGTFSSTAGLSVNGTTGAINLAASTPGTYTVTYSVAGTCSSSATQTVTITAAPLASFSYPATGTCAGSTGTIAPTLAAGATAGTFSSTAGLTLNATTGVISLATSTAGTYTVTNTVAAAGGCAATTATSTVTINATPARPTVSVVYNGTTTTLTSSATTGNQWYLNGTLIAGATGQSYVVNTPAQFGAYTVVTTSAQGCASQASLPLTVTSSVRPLAGASLSVFPNPTHDGNLTVNLDGYRHNVELTVYTALGQEVYKVTVKPSASGQVQQAINLSSRPAGVYILRAKTEGGLDTRRIVRD